MEYSDSEQRLINQLAAGHRPVMPERPGSTPPSATAPDGAAEPPETRVRAIALASILMGPETGEADLARGVHIRGYWIDGDLDLAWAHRLNADAGRAVVPLIVETCVIDGLVNLAGARTASVTLRNTAINGLTARGADIAGGLTLDGCVIQDAGDLLAGDRAPDPANATTWARSALGRVDLDGCAIGGDLNVRGLRVCGGPADAAPRLEIDADNAVIRGSVDLSTPWAGRSGDHKPVGRQPELYANFDNAEIFGDFRATGAWFAPLGADSDAAPPDCLDLRGVQVRGDLCLEHIRARGRIRLEDADIAQDLELGGARLVQPKGVALDAQGLVVHGSVHLVDRQKTLATAKADAPTEDTPDPRLVAYGQLRFARTRIGGDLDASGATVCAVDVSIEGVALDLRSAEVGGSIYLDGRRDVGPAFFVGLINLIQVRVNGSVVLSGSWFRAPCGQMMGPERIDLELPSEDDMRFALAQSGIDFENTGIDLETADYRGFTLADVYYGFEDQLQDSLSADRSSARKAPPESEVAQLIDEVGIGEGLRYSAKNLWRLRGGCRAIALEDARISGAVLFGTAIDIRRAPQDSDQNKKQDSDQRPDPRTGPSVVVGAVDMDRARIDGELRLTGGIFRAVTPVVRDVLDAEAATPVDDVADVSLSYPSTVGWTELKARTCLTLRGAQVGGRLDTRFFGALPPKLQSNGLPRLTEYRRWRHQLDLIPNDVEPACDEVDSPLTATVERYQRAAAYAEEMLAMLAYASGAERAADHAYGATRPHVPDVQDAPGGYHLRPDGLFDLGDAQLGAIHDHPAHGWPTSDGHVRLNGCTYGFLTLDVEESRIDAPGASPEHQEAIWKTPDSALTYADRTGGPWWAHLRHGVGRHLTGFYLALYLVPLWIARLPDRLRDGARFLFAARTDAAPRVWTRPRDRRWRKVRMRRRANRYRHYARRSFKRRNDNRCRPADRRIAWLEQQYHGADPSLRDFLPQPYEMLCRVMRANGYREDADLVAAAKRRQRSRATFCNPLLLIGEYFLRLTSNYGYSPARVVFVSLIVVGLGSATVQLAADYDLLAYESLQTEGVAVLNTVLGAGVGEGGDVPPREDLQLAPVLFAVDRFVPLVEFGYAAEWSVAEWTASNDTSDGPPYVLRGQVDGAPPVWPQAVRSLMIFDFSLVWPLSSPSLDGLQSLVAELLRLPVLALAWITGGFLAFFDCGLSYATCGFETAPPEAALHPLLEASISAWAGRDPETILRWLGAIYHGTGWALISMAIVTFTGVMRRD